MKGPSCWVGSIAFGVAVLTMTPGCSDFGDPPMEIEDDDGTGGATDSSVVLFPVRDNTLYEHDQLDLSSGAGIHLFVGKVGPPGTSHRRRGLVEFDIATNVPQGAVIDSVSLTLHLSNSSGAGASSISIELHRVLARWGEGSSDAGEPGGTGAQASLGDATWRHAFFDTMLWMDAGGDFSPTVSADQVVGEFIPPDSPANFYTWTAGTLVDDAQSMLDDPAGNFGWILIGNEIEDRTARRFHTREQAEPTQRPRLFVRFTLPAGR